nr:hypothetical protein CFP56_63941 [Quercus suber]
MTTKKSGGYSIHRVNHAFDASTLLKLHRELNNGERCVSPSSSLITATMTRRITRTLSQISAFTVVVFFLVFLADFHYSVLPDRIHDALPTSYHTGYVITDITISFCSSSNPFSNCRLDPHEWQRLEKDLYLQSGWLKSAWLHVKRKKETELEAEDKVVVGVKLGRVEPSIDSKEQNKEKWESRPGGIWILRSSKTHDSDLAKAVTAVDVLFGADAVDPRPDWVLARAPLLIGGSKELPIPRLTTRNGRPKSDNKEVVPRVRKDGRFKILQVSDAHLSTGTGACRDAIGPGRRTCISGHTDDDLQVRGSTHRA